MTEANEFFNSDLVREEIQDIQTTYEELLKMSNKLQEFSPQERLDHINKTLELIAKQKVFYARLALASHHVEENQRDGSVAEMKDRIDTMSQMYSGGLDLTMVLDQMESKLKEWKTQILESGHTSEG